jgi:hypothetical protein
VADRDVLDLVLVEELLQLLSRHGELLRVGFSARYDAPIPPANPRPDVPVKWPEFRERAQENPASERPGRLMVAMWSVIAEAAGAVFASRI